MIHRLPAQQRGHTDLNWLDSRHSFSFGSYYDPQRMGFRALRVINDDRVAPGAGFGTHPHRDMEIITYVLDGELAHKDNTGAHADGAIIRAGDFQRMSAGTGIAHSEFNPSTDRPVHFLQIWILPDRKGRQPEYEQKSPEQSDGQGLRLVASSDGRQDSLTVHQDVALYRGRLPSGGQATHDLAADRGAWLQVIRGTLEVNGVELHVGDGAALTHEPKLDFTAAKETEFLLFDLA